MSSLSDGSESGKDINIEPELGLRAPTKRNLLVVYIDQLWSCFVSQASL